MQGVSLCFVLSQTSAPSSRVECEGEGCQGWGQTQREAPSPLETCMLCKFNGKGLCFDILLRERGQYVGGRWGSVCLIRESSESLWQPRVGCPTAITVSDLCSEKSAGLHTEQLTKGGQIRSLLCSPGCHHSVRHARDKWYHLKNSSCGKPEQLIDPQRSSGDSGQDEP